MTDKIKSIFFAQYLWQRVLVYKEYDFPCELTFETAKYRENAYLLLRSIEQLTDEEYIELAKVFGYEADFYNGKEQVTYGRNIAEGILMPDFSGWSTIIITAIDWLRSIGILIPLTYLSEDNNPTTLTPSQIIEMGWAKYKNT